MKILILNGPNLNLLGIREKNIYGETSFEEYLSGLRDFYTMVEIDYYQSNVEGELINKIHEVGFSYDGIILNAGAYTHTSIAIADAISAIPCPVIEVHISFLTPVCRGVITGFGLKSYELALQAFM